MLDLTLYHYIAIALLGIIASIINIVAGGGSNLVLPVLMMFGITPDVANASNRVGVFLESLIGIRGFAQAKKIPSTSALIPILVPTLLGGAVGATLAAFLPNTLLKPILLLTMLFVAGCAVFKPKWFSHQAKEHIQAISPFAWLCLFGTGIYGGFVQGGVGLLMIPVLAGILAYDIVRTNALKVICTLGFTSISLLIFILNDKIWWEVGLILALGNMLGAWIGVKVALNISTQTLRWLIFLMTLIAVTLAIWS